MKISVFTTISIVSAYPMDSGNSSQPETQHEMQSWELFGIENAALPAHEDTAIAAPPMTSEERDLFDWLLEKNSVEDSPLANPTNQQPQVSQTSNDLKAHEAASYQGELAHGHLTTTVEANLDEDKESGSSSSEQSETKYDFSKLTDEEFQAILDALPPLDEIDLDFTELDSLDSTQVENQDLERHMEDLKNPINYPGCTPCRRWFSRKQKKV